MQSSSDLRARARELEISDQPQEALALYLRIVQDSPASLPTVWGKVGDLQVKLGEIEPGIDSLRRAIDGFLASGQKNNALVLFHHILELEDGSAELLLEVAQVALEQDYRLDARDALSLFARIAAEAGKPEEVVDPFVRFVRRFPDEREMWREWAEQLFADGRGEEAASVLKAVATQLSAAGAAAPARMIETEARNLAGDEIPPAEPRDEVDDAGIPLLVDAPDGETGPHTGAIAGLEPTIVSLDGPDELDSDPESDLHGDVDGGQDLPLLGTSPDLTRLGADADIDVNDGDRVERYHLPDSDDWAASPPETPRDEYIDHDPSPLPMLGDTPGLDADERVADIAGFEPTIAPEAAEGLEPVRLDPTLAAGDLTAEPDAPASIERPRSLVDTDDWGQMPGLRDSSEPAWEVQGDDLEIEGPVDLPTLGTGDTEARSSLGADELPDLTSGDIGDPSGLPPLSAESPADTSAFEAGAAPALQTDEAAAPVDSSPGRAAGPLSSDAARFAEPPALQPVDRTNVPHEALPSPETPAASGSGQVFDREGVAAAVLALTDREVPEADDPATHYDLAVAFKGMGLLDEAVAHLGTALAEGYDPVATLEVLGEILFDRGQVEEMVGLLQRLVRDDDRSQTETVAIHYWLGRGQEELRQPDLALASYRRVLDVESAFRDVRSRVDRLHSDTL